MIAWAVVAALGAPVDPLLVGADLPEGADVHIERGDALWTVTVGGRPMIVPAPRTATDEDAIRALVISLLSGLELVPSPPLPRLPPAPATPPPRRVEPVVAPAAPLVIVVPTTITLPAPAAPPAPLPVVVDAGPPPPPPAAEMVPAAPAPRRYQLWVSADAFARPGVDAPYKASWWATGGGGSVGAWFGRRVGAGVRVGARSPRIVTLDGTVTAVEVDADVELWGSPARWVTLVVAGGASGRRYALVGRVQSVHAMPRASAGFLLPVDAGGVTVAFGAAVELDLGMTRIGWVDSFRQVVPPTGLRLEARISTPREPNGRSTTSDQ